MQTALHKLRGPSNRGEFACSAEISHSTAKRCRRETTRPNRCTDSVAQKSHLVRGRRRSTPVRSKRKRQLHSNPKSSSKMTTRPAEESGDYDCAICLSPPDHQVHQCRNAIIVVKVIIEIVSESIPLGVLTGFSLIFGPISIRVFV